MADLRKLPKVDVLAASPRLERFSEAVRVRAARAAVATLRKQAQTGNGFNPEAAEEIAACEAVRIAASSLKRVLNASGVVLHTGLGRARLSRAAAERVYEVALSHSATEIDLETGQRGDRQSHVRELLLELTGAEAAYVVNNCAAAVLLSLSALCAGREVILSRGEMVEIGGAFRMPDVIRQSGCRLVEVGCTNKTHLRDYEEAISPETAAIVRCHPSNYRIVGFTETPSDGELADLAKSKGILFLHDLGNGCLWNTLDFGLPKDVTVQEAVAGGADVVTASGDKMLGGPQAGILLGSGEAIRTISKHPLARAVRVDKLTLAALEATLRLHFEVRLGELPVYRSLKRPVEEVAGDAQKLAQAYGGKAVVETGLTEVGGGSVPGVGIPTSRVGLESPDPEALAQRLRMSDPSLLGRIEKGLVWLDPRTLEPEEVEEAAKVLRGLDLK